MVKLNDDEWSKVDGKALEAAINSFKKHPRTGEQMKRFRDGVATAVQAYLDALSPQEMTGNLHLPSKGQIILEVFDTDPRADEYTISNTIEAIRRLHKAGLNPLPNTDEKEK